MTAVTCIKTTLQVHKHGYIEIMNRFRHNAGVTAQDELRQAAKLQQPQVLRLRLRPCLCQKFLLPQRCPKLQVLWQLRRRLRPCLCQKFSLLDQLITVNPYATPPSREDLRRSSAVGSTETPSESTPAPTMRRGLDGEGSTPVPKLPPMPTVRGSRTKAAAPYPVAPLLRISVLLLRDGFLCIKLWLPFLLGT